MIDPVTMNARTPGEDEFGTAMLNRMNDRHRSLYKWGLEHVSVEDTRRILDIGYGGGQNIHNLCRLAPEAKISGLDYSRASYRKCAEVNAEAIREGKVEIQIGSAEELPYGKNTFDLVTAFETVYYWPNITRCFRNVCDVLKDKGAFLICNEDSRLEGNEEIADALTMEFYDTEALEKLLKQAGFRTVHTYTNPNGKWVCAVGRK